MLYLVCIIILINLHNFLPSDDIWNKTLQYMEEGKMKFPDDKNYFIFDESNYTALDINGDKMEALFKKQKYLYETYKVPNYIFAVDNQDENLEPRSNATSNLAALLKSEFNINSDNAVIGFFSIETNRSRIRVGSLLRKIITDEIANLIAKDLQSSLRANDYYGAWDKLLDDVIVCKNPYEIFNNSRPSNSSNSSDSSQPTRQTYPGKSTKSKSKNWIIIFPIIFVVLAFGGIVFCIYRCIQKRQNSKIEKDGNFRKVCKFLKENRNNQAIFTEYCALCLEKLNNEPIQEIKTETGIIIKPEGIKTGNINTFNCGHQFHANCITQFKIAECPICKQRGNPDYNQEDAKIIWGTQACLFPILKGYNYNDIYLFDLNKPKISTSYKVNNDDHYDNYYPNNNISYNAPSNNVSYGAPSNNISYSAPSNNGGGASNNAPSIHSGGADGDW